MASHRRKFVHRRCGVRPLRRTGDLLANSHRMDGSPKAACFAAAGEKPLLVSQISNGDKQTYGGPKYVALPVMRDFSSCRKPRPSAILMSERELERAKGFKTLGPNFGKAVLHGRQQSRVRHGLSLFGTGYLIVI